MNARALFDAGRLDEAVESLGADLRKDPTDLRRRTFLFELLCFAGELDRAEKHLEIVARSGPDAERGAWLYRSALHAERTRQEMFLADGRAPHAAPPAAPLRGTLNGRPFASLADADPRIGARLEVYAAGQYTWLPLEHVTSVRAEPPRLLRDLLWMPAVVQVGPALAGLELGEVLLPVLYPLSWKDPDPAVRLGRATDVRETGGGEPVLVGQRILLADDEAVPLLELRELEIFPPETPAGSDAC